MSKLPPLLDLDVHMDSSRRHLQLCTLTIGETPTSLLAWYHVSWQGLLTAI
jgi:hypothetical protein